jgi:GTP cyclohydrolase III
MSETEGLSHGPMASRRPEIAIGVIGARELVDRIIAVAGRLDAPLRLVGAAYTAEQEGYELLADIEKKIDVALFAGPLAYDLAREHGDLPVPATYVPVSGAALYSTLLRGTLERRCDPARVSVDSILASDLEEAYTEIGVGLSGVHVHEYQHPDSAREFYDFHAGLYQAGATSAALTTMPTVERRLAEAGVPALRMVPTAATLRIALNTAMLLGTGSRLEESQIAIGVVELAPTARSGHSDSYGQQELNLALHRELLQVARTMGATVLPRGDDSYLIITTVGAVARETAGFRVAPFLDHVGRELGVPIDVGIGYGRTARDAEANARAAVERARTERSSAAAMVGPDGNVLSLPGRLHQRTEPDADPEVDQPSRGTDLLARLVHSLADLSDEALVVDAERVAELLDVTARTARRTLRTLVDEGLAWPVPPARTTGAGRPRQLYRLVTTKLTRDP